MAPSGKESNWVQTVPDKFRLPHFRLYVPTEAYFDKSWPLPNLEKAEWTSSPASRIRIS